MNKRKLAIATISLVRTDEEEQLMRASLQALSALRLPVFVTDGGSPEAFVAFLKTLPGVAVFSGSGLWPKTHNSLKAAKASGAETILYTEPDKLAFFKDGLPRMLNKTEMDEVPGVVLAARSAKAFATFPAFQQTTETAINNCCAEVTGKEQDYVYGPFFLNAALVDHLSALPEDAGWGWRTFAFVMAHRLGLPVESFTGEFACPEGQRTDDGKERIYRMKQLAQNINGIVLAAEAEMK